MHSFIPDIVLIENELTLNDLYSKVFSLVGLNTTHVYRTPMEFIKDYSFDQPRIIIQYHTMHGTTSFELLQYIRVRDKISYVIVLTTAHETKDQYIELGADCWLEKPSRIQVILENIVQACRIINKRRSEQPK